MRIRNITFILLGVAVLLLKSRYTGPFEVLVHSYLGNVAVSFAAYFWAHLIPIKHKHERLFSAGIALAIVELFEVFDGFGFMSNAYDPIDLIANLVGIMVGLAVDTSLALQRRAATNA